MSAAVRPEDKGDPRVTCTNEQIFKQRLMDNTFDFRMDGIYRRAFVLQHTGDNPGIERLRLNGGADNLIPRG